MPIQIFEFCQAKCSEKNKMSSFGFSVVVPLKYLHVGRNKFEEFCRFYGITIPDTCTETNFAWRHVYRWLQVDAKWSVLPVLQKYRTTRCWAWTMIEKGKVELCFMIVTKEPLTVVDKFEFEHALVPFVFVEAKDRKPLSEMYRKLRAYIKSKSKAQFNYFNVLLGGGVPK